jgi:hypothetical protein
MKTNFIRSNIRSSTAVVYLFEALQAQSLETTPFWMTLGESASLTSAASEVPGGTSTAGEQLKNPCGCSGENKLKFS